MAKKGKTEASSISRGENQARETPGRIKPALYFPALFVVAFLLRLLYLLQFSKTAFFHSTGVDSVYYLRWAASICDGAEFTKDAYFMGPLYPFFLSILMRLMGTEIFHLALVQIIIGSLSACFLAYVGMRVFDYTTGLLAGCMAALYIPFIFFEGLILMVTLYTILALASLFMAWLAMEKEKTFLFLAAGLLLGITALARANVLAFGFLFIFWLFLSRRRQAWRPVLLYFLGMVLAILPVTVRNYRAEGVFVPITSNAGLNFYIGNNENADGLYLPLDHLPLTTNNDRGLIIDGYSDFTTRHFLEQYLEKPLTSDQVSSFWINQVFTFIRHHPLRFAKNTLLKMVYFWNAFEIPQVESFYYIRKLVPFLRLPLLSFVVVGPLAIIGLFLAWQDRKKFALFYLFILAYFVSIIPFFVTSRYRIPVMPCLILFAAYTVSAVIRYVRNHEWRRISIMAVALALTGLAVNYPFHTGNLGMSQAINSFGHALANQGMYEKAIEAYELALSYNPYDYQVYYNMGTTCIRIQQYDRAIEQFKKAIELNPTFYSAWLNLSNIYYMKGMSEEDRKVQEKLIQLSPANFKAYYHMGNILKDQGAYADALKYYERAAELAPEQSYIRYNLATVLYLLGDYGRADKAFRKALSLFEDYKRGVRKDFEIKPAMPATAQEKAHYHASIYYNLAIIAERQGNIEEAIRLCGQSLRIRPDYPRALELLSSLKNGRG